MVQSKTGFILATVVFLLFIVQISALVGTNFLLGIDPNFSPPAPPTDPLTTLLYVIGNVGVFFALMGANSSFLLFGSVLLTGITLALFWALLELIRGV